MNKKKFKLGDRVRINNKELCKSCRGKTGTIIQTDRIRKGFSETWDYEVSFDDKTLEDYVFTPEEMEKEFAKGEQLLFEFML